MTKKVMLDRDNRRQTCRKVGGGETVQAEAELSEDKSRTGNKSRAGDKSSGQRGQQQSRARAWGMNGVEQVLG